MSVSDEYITFVRDLLADFEPLRVKRMFGGAGVYSGELFIAILVDDLLYLKADEANRPAYEALGIAPFRYETKSGRSTSMGFYSPPAEVLEDRDALREWVQGALEAARRTAAGKATPSRHRT